MGLASELELHPCLRARVHRVNPAPTLSDVKSGEGFVLYLPTVCLRFEQNPAFAVACRAANKLGVPLVVLAVVVDDASHACAPHRMPPLEGSSHLSSSVVMTARRLAFTLQALSHAGRLWSEHGAAVGIRIHSANHPKVTGARTPDHLTLASRASFVVTDEPFVSPYTTFVQKVEGACKRAGVECVRVDGSCTVPPLQVLRKRTNGSDGSVKFDGVPGKAYQWQSKTEHLREGHLRAAMKGHFDAPELQVKMEDEDLFGVQRGKGEPSTGQRLAHLFPSRWQPKQGATSLPSAPDVRPFTSRELSDLYDVQSKTPLHQFALSWSGADATVPPCTQTIGTTTHGMARWNNFVQNGGLARYGKERNNARLVHSVSRMSAFLNLGIVSIFRIVYEVKQAQSKNGNSGKAANSRWSKNKSGPDKYEEEIIKWREYSYAHAFSREDYDDVGSVPRWSVTCLNGHPNTSRFTLEELARGATGDAVWDSMQQYLVRTGELHNNVRMTWGKQVVEWVGCRHSSGASPAQLTLRTICYLNDRYALDGLSPPSYAGLLWCMGWTDKPTSSGGGWTIATKPAHRYRMTPDEFRGAEEKLMASRSNNTGGSASGVATGGMKRQRSVLDMMQMQSSTNKAGSASKAPDQDAAIATKSPSGPKTKGLKRNGSGTLDSFFSKKPKG
ncbi:hypothetical protein ACHAXT_001487 [Thalassiosira profunda]